MAIKIVLMGVMNLSFATVQTIFIWWHLNAYVMATETVKINLMRIQMSASARKKTSSVKGSMLLYFPDFDVYPNIMPSHFPILKGHTEEKNVCTSVVQHLLNSF
jgi:hypothetical protein